MRMKHLGLTIVSVLAASCSGAGAREEAHRREVTVGVKRFLATHIDGWLAASRDLREAAPLPADRGWDAQLDGDAIEAMRSAWKRARHEYELIEGAIAPIFPESDAATDARYEDFLARMGADGDRDPFDDKGVIGMHAIERILFLSETPARVRAFELGLRGQHPARQPSTAAEATRFKQLLAGRMVADIEQLAAEFQPLELDLGFAFRGLIDLVNEQVEKVDKTASGEEESRYAQWTLADLRANQQGVAEVYALFRPWLLSRRGGDAQDAAISAGLARLKAALDEHVGHAMPQPPARWSSVRPTPEALGTPFGRLFATVKAECDPAHEASLHAALLRAAVTLGLGEAP
ncbi:MAG TPA: imelysin family protein [Polyangia bacterium]